MTAKRSKEGPAVVILISIYMNIYYNKWFTNSNDDGTMSFTNDGTNYLMRQLNYLFNYCDN